jgi:16S rRNA (cytidine1402-2'-O)-methyltransferase
MSIKQRSKKNQSGADHTRRTATNAQRLSVDTVPVRAERGQNDPTPPISAQIAGTLYIIATPIGNLRDISARALEVLASVSEVLCEDTRSSSVLLRHYAIQAPLSALHDHNETQKTQGVLQKLREGKSLALISDAGTPLISDPGYTLVAAARAAGMSICAIPGPCALIAALSISGLPCERFCFEGFLPAQSKARKDRLLSLQDEPRTLVFYEATHRICEMLADVQTVLGAARPVALVKEITKHFEQCLFGSAESILSQLNADSNLQRGEFVVVIQGAAEKSSAEIEARRVFVLLSEEMSKSQAAKLAAKLTGVSRRLIYSGE